MQIHKNALEDYWRITKADARKWLHVSSIQFLNISDGLATERQSGL